MENQQQAVVILCTCPTKTGVAQGLAQRLVESGLVACVNILPKVQSIYHWQGQIEKDEEVLLIIKSVKARYQAIEQMLNELHPYEVPEIIMLPIEEGSNNYLKWLTETVSNKK